MKLPGRTRINSKRIDLRQYILELVRNGSLEGFDLKALKYADDYRVYFFPDNPEATEDTLKEAMSSFFHDHSPNAVLRDPAADDAIDTQSTSPDPERWLSRNFKFQPIMAPFCEQMAEQVAEYHKKSRADYKENILNTLMLILGNLHHNHTIDSEMYCLVTLANNSWEKGEYNSYGIGVRSVRDVIKYLRDPEVGYLEIIEGYFNRNFSTPKGGVTRVRGSTKLIEDINRYLSNPSVDRLVVPSVTRNTYSFSDPHSPMCSKLYHQMSPPIIQLKSDTGKLETFEPNDETKGMGARLDSYNSFINNHWLDLLVPDNTLIELSSGCKKDSAEDSSFQQNNQELSNVFSLGFDNQLYRVFNNSSFEQGGRFYGGWWQSIKSEYRKFITINWYTTREVDYSNLAAAMLYAKEGHALPDDAYSIEGIPTEYRKLIKQTFFKLINAKGKVRAPRKDALPDGWTWKHLQEALAEKHNIISDHFNSGIGIYLQRVDSDIAEQVMLEMMSRGKLALPIHDSFVVRDGHEGELTEVMKSAYRSTMQADVKADPSVSWADELPDNAFELDQHGVFDIEDNIGKVEQQKGYERYVARKQAFTSNPKNEHNLREYGLYV